jgi:hypothetical protein
MGAGGRDVLLSEAGLRCFNFAIECKSRASIAIYGDYEQACSHRDAGEIPLLVIKQNHSEPLAVVSLDHFMELTGRQLESKKDPKE